LDICSKEAFYEKKIGKNAVKCVFADAFFEKY
jgi:hypothetical protein